MFKNMRKISEPALAFAIPVLIFLIIFAVNGITPFGGTDAETFVTGDLKHQYYPILTEVQRKLHGGESLFYSFRGGTGMNFWALLAFQSSSPINLLLLKIIPESGLTLCTFLIIIIKIGLAGTGMYLFLRSEKLTANMLIGLGAASAYALSSWTLAYFIHIVLLDGLMLLPFIIMGLRALINNKRSLLYTISMAIVFISNYYMAAMILIFVAACTVVFYFEKERPGGVKAFGFTVLRVAAHSALGILASGFFLVPVGLSLIYTPGWTDAIGMRSFFPDNWLDMISGVLPFGSLTTTTGAANIASTALVVLLIPLYFLNSRFTRRERLCHALLAGWLFLSANIKPLDLVINFMHNTNGAPYRWSFMFIFLMIFLAIKALKEIDGVSARYIFISAGAFAGLNIYLLLNDGGAFVFVNFITLAVYAIVLSMKIGKKAFNGIIAGVLFFEVFLSTFAGIKSVESYDDVKHEEVSGLLQAAVEDATAEENPFYRIEIPGQDQNYNGAYLYGYNGVSVYASSLNGNVSKLMRSLKQFADITLNCYRYVPSSPEFDKLFAVKYLVAEKGTKLKNPNMTKLKGSGDYVLYKNNANSSLGYVLPKGDYSQKSASNTDIINGIPLMKAVSSSDSMVFDLKMSDDDFQGSFVADKEGTLFLSIPYDKGWHFTVDGEPVEAHTLARSYTGIDVASGTHDIKGEYIPEGFTAGVIISCISTAMIVAYEAGIRRWIKR